MSNNIYQAYYTKSEPIVKYMTDLLSLQGDEKILEPCAGDGVFIDHLLSSFGKISVDALELDPISCNNLRDKYKETASVSITETDTILDDFLAAPSLFFGGYDAVIANPPYGAWRNVEQRKLLKKRYSDLYVKESYTLFLFKCIDALKEGGKLTFIIPDTYLNLHNHGGIRKVLLLKTKLKEISLFPSSFFPGVNFGYSNLSIISLEKCSNYQECIDNSFRIVSGYRSVSELGSYSLENINIQELTQFDVINNPDHAFFYNSNQIINECLAKSDEVIGNICDCVTGFYSGNDKKHLMVISSELKKSKKYNVVDIEQVEFDSTINNIANGLCGEKRIVPIVKGGNTKYYKQNNWFMHWSIEDVISFKKGKKSRYQNSSYYFKNGIAIPMVSSSSITASLLDNRLFDQSIVGIFPKKEMYIFYLLAFFNSPTCNSLIRTINPSTNNSANYIKKIPFFKPTDNTLEIITQNIIEIINTIKNGNNYRKDMEDQNNELIKNLYGF